MRNLILLSLFVIFSSASNGAAISTCNGPCKNLNDCDGQLICINGKCNDDPDVGTHICSNTTSSSSSSDENGSYRPLTSRWSSFLVGSVFSFMIFRLHNKHKVGGLVGGLLFAGCLYMIIYRKRKAQGIALPSMTSDQSLQGAPS